MTALGRRSRMSLASLKAVPTKKGLTAEAGPKAALRRLSLARGDGSQHRNTLDSFWNERYTTATECEKRQIRVDRWHSAGAQFGCQGYATLGQIGFSERSGYTAIGTVCNLAARLCAEAKDGQILISSRVARAVEALAKLEDLGNLELKGLRRPVAAFNVVQSSSSGDARPNLIVVGKGQVA